MPAAGFQPALGFGHSATLTWRTLSACRDRTPAVAAGGARATLELRSREEPANSRLRPRLDRPTVKMYL